MNVSEIFNSQFVDRVRNILDEECKDGRALTREELARRLDLPPNAMVENCIGALVNLEVIPGFDSRRGPGGGICKAGEKPAKGSAARTGARSTQAVSFPDGFLEKLEETLESACTDGKAVPRRDLATTMGCPGSDTENLISHAIKGPLSSKYKTRKGPQGGVFALVESDSTTVPAPAMEDGDEDSN